MEDFEAVKTAARACTRCAAHLPHDPRPLLRGRASARILIVGQAPGSGAHASGIPWNDPSGDRLRSWLALNRETFYDERRIAIVPMGLCYPGRLPRGGDAPPPPECAPLWQDRARAALPALSLILLVGLYAQAWSLDARRRPSMTETVRAFRDYAPLFWPLPHPSWRNTAWLAKNPWFETDVLPLLRQRAASLL